MLKPKDITSIIINVLFVASFLSIFFFTYAVKIEEEIVIDQVDYLVKDFTSGLKLLPDETLIPIRNRIKSFEKPNMDVLDKKVEDSNKAIFKQAIMIVSITLAVGLIGAFIASRKWNFSMFDLIKENLIILLFVGLTEFIFLNVFGKNFISADPNSVKLALLNKLTSL
jgi:hypothetical protein